MLEKLTNEVLKKNIPKKIEWDFNVPDQKNDILKILSQSLEATILEYYIKDDYFSGKVSVTTNVLYIPENSDDMQIANLESTEVFVIKMDIPKNLEWEFESCDIQVTENTSSLINSRKVGVRGNLQCVVSLIQNIPLPTIECDNSLIETKTKEIVAYYTPILTTEKFTVSLNVPLPAGNPPILEVLQTNLSIQNKDLKPISNKVVLKGDLVCKFMYISVLNSIEVAEFTSQFTEIVDIAGLTDDLDITYDVKINRTLVEVSKNEDDEIRNISVNGFVELKVTAIKTDTAVVAIDAYSPVYEEKFNKELIKFEELSKVNIDNYLLKEALYFDDTEILQVISIYAKPIIRKADINGNKVDVDAYLEAVILLKAQNGISSYTKEIAFSYTAEGFFNGSYDTVSINAELSNISYNISGSNCIEIRSNILFNTRLSKVISLDLISDITLDKDKKHKVDRAPIVAYFVKEGDTLFSIAKKYKTTIANLMKINNICNENEIKADSYIIIE